MLSKKIVLSICVGFLGLGCSLGAVRPKQEQHVLNKRLLEAKTVDEATQALTDGAEINAKNHNGETALCQSLTAQWFRNVNPEIAKLLIESGADISEAGPRELTPLHLACRSDLLEIVKLLVECGASLNPVGRNEISPYTPLYFACENGSLEVIRFLLEKKADVNKPGGYKRKTPLYVACKKGYHDVVALLIDHGADVNAKNLYGYTPLHTACWGGYHDIVTLLIDQGADINAHHFNVQSETPLYMAAYAGKLDVVRLLIAKGALVDQAIIDATADTNVKQVLQEAHAAPAHPE